MAFVERCANSTDRRAIEETLFISISYINKRTNFNSMDIGMYYDFIGAVSSVLLGTMTFFDEIARKFPLFSFLKSLILKVPLFLFLSGLIVTMLILKGQETSEKEFKSADDHVKEVKLQDSLYREYKFQTDSIYLAKKRFSDSIQKNEIATTLDSSYIKSIKASNEALAKYNIIFIDSLRTVKSTLRPEEPEPEFGLAIPRDTPNHYFNRETIDGEDWLTTHIVSLRNTSFNINATVYILKNNWLKAHVLRKKIFFQGVNSLDVHTDVTVQVEMTPTILDQSKLIIIFYGYYYKNRNSTEKIILQECYSYEPNSRKTQKLFSQEVQHLVELVKIL